MGMDQVVTVSDFYFFGLVISGNVHEWAYLDVLVVNISRNNSE